jgi:hypothetical protein
MAPATEKFYGEAGVLHGNGLWRAEIFWQTRECYGGRLWPTRSPVKNYGEHCGLKVASICKILWRQEDPDPEAAWKAYYRSGSRAILPPLIEGVVISGRGVNFFSSWARAHLYLLKDGAAYILLSNPPTSSTGSWMYAHFIDVTVLTRSSGPLAREHIS